MIVAVAIVGIMAAAVLTTLDPLTQIKKANDGRRKSDLAQIQKSLESYYQDHNSYPASTNNRIDGISWGSSWQPYMNVIPKDPNSKKKYVYAQLSSGQGYCLYASLDKVVSSDQCHGSSPCGDSSCNNGGTSTICNFGLCSPDITP